MPWPFLSSVWNANTNHEIIRTRAFINIPIYDFFFEILLLHRYVSTRYFESEKKPTSVQVEILTYHGDSSLCHFLPQNKRSRFIPCGVVASKKHRKCCTYCLWLALRAPLISILPKSQKSRQGHQNDSSCHIPSPVKSTIKDSKIPCLSRPLATLSRVVYQILLSLHLLFFTTT